MCLIQLCASNIVATVWERTTYGCNGQVSLYFWLYSVTLNGGSVLLCVHFTGVVWGGGSLDKGNHTGHLYPTMKHFCLDGLGLFSGLICPHAHSRRAHWIVWWGKKWCKSRAVVSKVIRISMGGIFFLFWIAMTFKAEAPLVALCLLIPYQQLFFKYVFFNLPLWFSPFLEHLSLSSSCAAYLSSVFPPLLSHRVQTCFLFFIFFLIHQPVLFGSVPSGLAEWV